MGIARIVALATSLFVATAQTTYANDIDALIKFAADGDKVFQALIIGSGRTLEAVNVALEDKGEPKFFCAPDKLVITGEQYRRILGSYVEKHPKIGSTTINGLGYVMIIALKDVFPC